MTAPDCLRTIAEDAYRNLLARSGWQASCDFTPEEREQKRTWTEIDPVTVVVGFLLDNPTFGRHLALLQEIQDELGPVFYKDASYEY